MTKKSKEPLSIREKIVIKLVMFLIQVIEPYEYEHQFSNHFKEMDTLIKGKFN